MAMRSAVAPLWEEKREEQSRSMIHEKLDEWLDEVLPEVFSEDREPTLMEMSELLTRTRQKFLGEWLGVLIEEKYAELLDQEYAPCPACGRMRKKRLDSGKELVSMQGSAKIQRPWFYCEDCSLGYSPLDEVLQVSAASGPKNDQFDRKRNIQSFTFVLPFDVGRWTFDVHF